jgi:hypothetical protein
MEENLNWSNENVKLISCNEYYSIIKSIVQKGEVDGTIVTDSELEIMKEMLENNEKFYYQYEVYFEAIIQYIKDYYKNQIKYHKEYNKENLKCQ